MITSRTVRAETDLADLMEEKGLAPAAVEVTRNSSGMPVVIFNDASGIFTEVKSAGDATERGSYSAALTADQYTTPVSGLSGFSRVAVAISLDAGNLDVSPRWSSKSSPDKATDADWYRETVLDRTASPITYVNSVYRVAGGDQGVLEMPVMGTHLSLVYWGAGGDAVNVVISVSAL